MMKATFVKFFGVMIGVAWITYGALMIAGAVTGTGPCRLGCQLGQTMIVVLGQAGYNKVFGGLWMLCGLAFVTFILRNASQRRRR
jgi:hypothetical protein